MAPQVSSKDHELVKALFELSKKNKKLVLSSEYAAPADPNVTVRSWKMNEFKYYDVPSPFPTLARGLFTEWYSEKEKSKEGDQTGMYRIVARGYDKFFNIGEVPWCTWDALEKHTAAPYIMTLKSNGCIIFIAPLSPTKLLVTSKHSLGPVQYAKLSHAQAGEQWLLKHLEAKGKTTEELAQTLWDNNWTAVAELCDDSFEEHVLPYSPEKTGLHLHGINESTGAFKTVLSDRVAEFAREWGLIETPYHIVNSIADVRAFSNEVAKSGQWNGESIEGFVVRSHVAANSTADRDAPPYKPGSSFFFKVKYDEPYMMYRDWREITKKLLGSKEPVNEVTIPKAKLRRPESKIYLDWIRNEIQRDRKQFENFNKGRGIIATRERFLQWMKSEKGDAAQTEQLTGALASMSVGEKDSKPKKEFGKTIIVPVAVPGCGKTTVGVALAHLFGFGHVQSDDIRANKATAFIKGVVGSLKNNNVVIADKNNHLTQHRRQLRDATLGMHPPVRLMALNWNVDKPPAMVHRICSDRVLLRGDNHQTLRADPEAREHEQAIWMFLDQMDELSESEVDEVVEMDLEEDLEQSLDRAVDACVRILGLKKPTPEQVGQALAKARGYTVTDKQELKARKPAKVRYYGLLPEVDLENVVEARFKESDVHQNTRKLWEFMKQEKRVATTPHVTLVHSKNLPEDQELWDLCHSIFTSESPPTFSFKLGHLISDGRVMAATVEDLKVTVDPGEDTNQEAIRFVESLDKQIIQLLHVTIGTRNKDVNPFEARSAVEAWRRGKAGKELHSLQLEDVSVKGRIKGLTG